MKTFNPYYGLYAGQVTRTDDPEKRGRIKCVIPDVIGVKTESAWCEPCVTVAYDKGGDFCCPTIDEFVWIMFREGNPNKPVYIGGWWSKEKVPKKTYDELDNYRIMKYKNCNIIMVNDKMSIEVVDEDEKPQTIIDLTDKDVTLSVLDSSQNIKSKVFMDNSKVTLEARETNTEVTVEDKKVTIRGDLYVEGDIYGTKNAFLDKSVYAVDNVEAEKNVLAGNNVEADNNVNANNEVNASVKVNSPLGEITRVDSSSVNSGTVTSQSVNSLEVESTNLRSSMTELGDVTATSITSNAITANGVNLATHIHTVTVQGQITDTSAPTNGGHA